MSISALTVNGTGTLSGTDNLTVSGLITYGSNGLVSDSGTIVADGGISISTNHGTGGTMVLSAGTLENFGTAVNTTSGGGDLELENGASIVNEPGATWEEETQGIVLGSGTATFTNEGSFISTSTVNAPPSNAIDVVFNNTTTNTSEPATVTVSTGTLELEDGGTSTGTGNSFSVASGATLEFDSSYSIDAHGSITGAGTVNLASGTLTLASGAFTTSAAG